MSLHDRITEFVQQKLVDLDKEVDGGLTSQTSLIQSGLFDSLAILQLANWVDGEIDAPLDLASVDIQQQWDSITDIAEFVKSHQADP